MAILASPLDSPKTPGRRELFLLFVILAAGAFLRLYKLDVGYFSLHTTRDLYRTLLMMRGVEISLLGSEVHFGGRVLGPVMYVLCILPMSIAVHPLSLAYFIAVLSIGLLPVIWWFSRRFFGPMVGIWTVALYAFFPLEIAQLRFNWNPSFIPLFICGFLFCTWGALVLRRHLAWLGAVVFLVLAFQVHLSAFKLLFTLVPLMIVAGYRPPLRVAAATAVLVLLLFTPAIISELRSETQSNVVTIITAPDSERGPLERFTPNPNGIRNFFYHVRLEWHEREWDMGFSYLFPVRNAGDVWIGPRKMQVAAFINGFAKVQMLFWVVGFAYCIHRVRLYRRTRPPRGSAERDLAVRAMLPYLALILMQVTPMIMLSFFRFGGSAGSQWNVAPLRYYLVSYPAPFLTSAIGIAVLSGLLLKWETFFGDRAYPVHRWVHGSAVALVVLQMVFALLFIQVVDRSGRIVPYAWPNYAPNIRSQLQMRELLLGEAGVDVDAWYERTHSQQLFDYRYGETTLDWLITQDPRSITNPVPDPHLRWLLHSPMPDRPHAVLPEGGTEVRRWHVPDVGMTLVEYRVEDPAVPVPDNVAMRNYYYQNERMLYLGPDAALRAQALARYKREPRP